MFRRPKPPRISGYFLSALVATLVSSCRFGPASAIRPKAARVAETLDESAVCHPRSRSNLLLVDFSEAARSELEVAKDRGLVVVNYDCHSLRILPTCSVGGPYTFVGVTPKQHTLHLDDADELSANAILSPASKLEGSLKRGQALDVTWVQSGLLESSVGTIRRDELRGNCAGATHVIGRLVVGAFTVTTSTKASLHANGSVATVNAMGHSNSARDEHYEDGNIDICASTSPRDPNQNRFCQALVHADLLAIDEPLTFAALTESKGQLGSPVTVTRLTLVPNCPIGYVSRNGNCRRETKGTLRHCTPTDLADCTAQCDGGDADSCESQAQLLLNKSSKESTMVHAIALRRRGCDLGSGVACTGLATMLERGQGVSKSVSLARQLYQAACAAGTFSACTSLGLLDYRTGGEKNIAPEILEGIASTFERACIGGDAIGCFLLGAINGYLSKSPNLVRAKDAYARACRAGFGIGCTNWAALLVEENTSASGELNSVTFETADDILVYGCRLGERTACLFGACLNRSPNWEHALDYLDEGCEAGHLDCCGDAGRLSLERGNSNQRATAKKYLERACQGNDVSSCMRLAEPGESASQSPEETAKRLSLLDRTCQMDPFGLACLRLGELYDKGDQGPVDPIRAVTYYSESCQRNNEEGCRKLAAAYTAGIGVPKDTNRAIDALSPRCNLRVKEGPTCDALGHLLLEGFGGVERIDEGISALQFACDRNQSPACTTLGHHYLSQKNAKERERAVLFYQKGCKFGSLSACRLLEELTGQPAPPKEPKIELGSAVTGCLDRELEVFFE